MPPRKHLIENGRLTPRQEAIAACLAAGWSLAGAARHHNVGQSSVYRWYSDVPAFKKRIEELRAMLLERGIAKLANLISYKAVRWIEALGDDAKSEAVRLEAAKAVFELHANATAAAGLKDRLAAVEEILKGKGTRK
jgi:hypothetical protein